MNTQDYYLEAVRTWKDMNKKGKHFAECCWHVSDRQTKALAEDCGCSADTIENYRNAYTLYQQITSERVGSLLWDSASIQLWVKAAQLKSRLGLSVGVTAEYLRTAAAHNMNRNQLAAHVDEKENHVPKWIRRLRSAIKFLSPSKDDYKSPDMPVQARERYDKAVEWFVGELEAIASEAVPELPMVTEFQMLTGETEGEQA